MLTRVSLLRRTTATSTPAPPVVRLVKARYLGGHDRKRPMDMAMLEIGPKQGVRVRGIGGWTIPWSDVAALETGGGDPKSRITGTRVALLGPLALAARKRKDSALLTIVLTDGRQVLFEMTDVAPNALAGNLAVLRPLLPRG